MFSWLLMSSGVIDNPSSGDNAPDFIVSYTPENIELYAGLALGIFGAIIVFLIIKVIKSAIEYEKDDCENKDEESDK